MKDENCIFCKLANGDIPTRTIYEDEKFRVILDASPASRGHALILPKEHYANLYEIPEETAGEAMKLAKRLAGKMTQALGCDGFNLVQNNGETAGQTVFHFHLCPNRGTGGYGFHGAYEHITAEGMDKSAAIIKNIISQFAHQM